MKLANLTGVVTLAVFLGACATQSHPPISLNTETLGGGNNRIAVSMKPIPATDTSFPGAGCLICIGVARGAHSDLSTQIQSLKPDALQDLPNRLAQELRDKGAIVSIVEEPVNLSALDDFLGDVAGRRVAEKDFRALASRLNADKLLLIEILDQGVLRPYSGYFPTDIPRAHVTGEAYMIDLKSNVYDWYWPINTSVVAQGNWKEPPAFPGLTNAYHQAVEQARDQTVASLNDQDPAAGREAAKVTKVSEATRATSKP